MKKIKELKKKIKQKEKEQLIRDLEYKLKSFEQSDKQRNCNHDWGSFGPFKFSIMNIFSSGYCYSCGKINYYKTS